MSKKLVIASCLACVVAGYLIGSVEGFNPLSPLAPQRDRPIVRLLSRVAKLGLWVMVFTEPAPQSPELQYASQRVHCPAGSIVCHQEGW